MPAPTIKACNKCWHAFTLAEWEGLPVVNINGTLQTRTCDYCGEELQVDMDGLTETEKAETEKADTTPPPPKVAGAKPITPRKKIVRRTAKPPAARATGPGAKTTPIQIAVVSLRRAPAAVTQGIKLWLRRLPAEAADVTLGELRELVIRGGSPL